MKTNLFTIFFLLSPFWGFAQYTISGKITDQFTQQPLVGANLRIENTLIATATDGDGNFVLRKIPKGIYRLVVSFVGYETYNQEIQINQNLEMDITVRPQDFLFDEIVVSATRANETTPVAYLNLEKKDIQKQNLGQDLPILLNFTPSVVSTSDAGAGVGYTGLRIRGSDATRINVTINGIPLNDSESQGVFWVNMPDFASSVSSIQIQRGVGTSTNGAGAFGASINIQTNERQENPYLTLNNSFGSFNTRKHTLMLGTGLLNQKFTLDARLSQIRSDGFIDRAFSDLKSFYVSAGYYGKKSNVRLNIFSGKEQTFQAWYGIPESKLRGDRAGMESFIERNFLDDEDAQNLLNANNRTYNFYTYPQQVDNYQQDHTQFFYNLDISQDLTLQTALHYTHGEGYFEEFRKNDLLEDYGLENILIENTLIEQTDLVRRRWLNNDFWGGVFSFNYQKNNTELILGGGWNQYRGNHYGEIIWAEFSSNNQLGDRYYDNDARKTDENLFTKISQKISNRLSLFGDVQYRRVSYSFLGFLVDALGARNVQQEAVFNFFNPKFGFTYQLNKAQVFSSFAVGNKEPNRDDFVQSSQESRPKSERLYDWEVGYRQKFHHLQLNLTYYWMNYKNQLVLTGEVNDVGAYNRTNIERSYRMGLEAELVYQFHPHWQWNMNVTWSRNKIKDFREFVDDFDNGGQIINTYSETDIAFSPNWIAGSQLEYRPNKFFGVALLTKYVDVQFLDNTANPERKLDAYLTNDLRFNSTFYTKWAKEISLNLLVNNLFNNRYESNGYTFGYIFNNQRITENFYYPQAGINFLVSVELRF